MIEIDISELMGIFPKSNPNTPTAKVARMLGIPTKELATILYSRPDRNSHYSRVEIAKNSSSKDKTKVRVLNVPSEKLKDLQRTTYEYLSKQFEPTKYAKGFVVGGSIFSNAWPHRRQAVVLKFDIKDFFPSITFPRVRGMFMSWPFEFSKDISTVLTQICSMDKGSIAQGAPTSPYISNMICRRLDKRISNFAFINHLTYTRYADDITISSSNSNLGIKNIQNEITSYINDEHFVVNEEKLRVLYPSQRQIITGIVTNDGINVPRKYVRQIRSLLYQCETWGVHATALNYLQNPLDKGPCLAIAQNEDEPFVDINGRKLIRPIFSKYPTFETPGPNPLNYIQFLMMFLAHLRGRILYVGQVAKANIDLSFNNESEFALIDKNKNMLAFHRRYKIYRDFLDRFNAIVDQDEYSKLFAIRIKSKRTEYMDGVEQKSFLEKPFVDLKEEIKSRSKIEPRYFYSFMPNTIESEVRKRLVEMIQRHQPDAEITRYILDSAQDSGSFIMRILHNETISHTEYDEFMDNYLLLRDKLPPRLEAKLTQLLKKVDQHFSINELTEYNFFEDDKFRTKEIIPFKDQTRFVVNPNKSNGGTDLYQLVIRILRSKIIKSEIKKKKLSVVIPENKVEWRTDLYTHVESVEWALRRIFESMVVNSVNTTINFSVETKSNGRNIFRIYNEDTDVINVPPDRSFLNGKLRNAMRYLDGFAGYSIEANFLEQGNLSLNLYTNETTALDSVSGFTHVLEF